MIQTVWDIPAITVDKSEQDMNVVGDWEVVESGDFAMREPETGHLVLHAGR
jgi:hypothetical protein